MASQSQSAPSLSSSSQHVIVQSPPFAAESTISDSERTPILLRLFEILVAGTSLILTAPLLAAIAMIVRLESRGPALFLSKRMGINRKPFTFVKFRTMYSDARKRFPELYAYKFSDSQKKTMKFKFKVDNDPRITPMGRWLRITSLDELPNFWNVLMGDMALVGPRPEIPEMLPYYSGDMLRKYSVRPGITGMAQVSGRGNLLFQQTVDCDLEYVRNRSFALDLKILLKTFRIVFTRHGAV